MVKLQMTFGGKIENENMFYRYLISFIVGLSILFMLRNIFYSLIMSSKQTLIIIAVIVILMIGLYYLMSPLQNCLRFPLECPYLPELFLEP